METYIVKRDGKHEVFTIDKIKAAIAKSFLASGAFATQEAMTGILSHLNIQSGISVEEIQNQVEVALMAEGYYQVAKTYMLYRNRHAEDRETKSKLEFLMGYCQAANAAEGSKFDANANVENKNIATLIGELPKKGFIRLNRRLLCDRIRSMYGKEVADKYLSLLHQHFIYKNDETNLANYCASITMYPWLLGGTKSIGGNATQPTNLKSFCGGFINMVFMVSSMLSGACATPEFLMYMNYFIEKEFGEDYYKRADEVVDLSLKHRTIDKIITDCCMVGLSALTSLIFFHALVGVREGTVISALTVGFLMKRMMRVCQAPLLRFVERETKLERVIRQDGLPESGKGGLILTISRETGSDGLWVAEALSNALGIPFYDDETLIPLEAEESGLSEDFIRAHEQTMGQNLLYDFLTSGYAMYNEDLPPVEKLFAAQCRVLRKIAAEGQGCVIVGRCADYILYQEPRSFRVFLHARPQWRARQLAEWKQIPLDRAVDELERTDAARARYYQNFTGRKWGDTRWFHLTVDTEVFDREQCVALILEGLKLRGEI